MVKTFAKSSDPLQLCVTGIVIPTDGGHCIFRLEQVGYRRVVNNDYIFHGSAQSGQVFDIRVIEEGAVLAEEQIGAHFARIQILHQRLRILRETRCEDDKLVNLVHLLEELGYIRSHKDINSANLTINFDWEHNIGIFNRLERGVDKGLI